MLGFQKNLLKSEKEMKCFKVTLLFCICIVMFIGCDSSDNADEPIYSQVTLQNDSNNELTQFYIRKAGTQDWGEDLIADFQSLGAHNSADFTISKCDEFYEFKAATLLSGTSWSSTESLYAECGIKIKFIITDK
jgi:hypothetical protein